LALGSQGFVRGKISAEEATISGKVDGDVQAGNIQLGPTADVNGTLAYRDVLCIAPGALFQGECRKRTEETDISLAAE
jgi:cytoskeletal protein CcmA (bactofilin family)